MKKIFYSHVIVPELGGAVRVGYTKGKCPHFDGNIMPTIISCHLAQGDKPKEEVLFNKFTLFFNSLPLEVWLRAHLYEYINFPKKAVKKAQKKKPKKD